MVWACQGWALRCGKIHTFQGTNQWSLYFNEFESKWNLRSACYHSFLYVASFCVLFGNLKVKSMVDILTWLYNLVFHPNERMEFVWDLRFSQQCYLSILQCYTVSVGHSWTCWRWRWRRYDPSKYEVLLTQQHSLTSQENFVSSSEICKEGGREECRNLHNNCLKNSYFFLFA
jgi:hypothetical protein